ncbi:hypothetical protein K9863_05635, partial [Lactobacillaceae bacterium KNUT 0156]|nr:hypothetical protein [Weissella cibaria]
MLRKTVGLGNGLHSDLIPAQSGSQISMSMAYYNSSEYNGTVPMAFYVRFYDADKKYIFASTFNGSASTSFRTDTYTANVPEKAAYVSVNVLYNGATGTIYYSQPMLVFSKTVGSYVQGNYNNNDAVAKAQLTADQATVSINNYKSDADGRISKA